MFYRYSRCGVFRVALNALRVMQTQDRCRKKEVIKSTNMNRGSGIGPTFIFLWIAPAANILALTYTGAILGFDMAVARIAVAFATAFLVGIAMTIIFRNDEASRTKKMGSERVARMSIVVGGVKGIVLIALLLVTLLMPNYLGAVLPNYLNINPGEDKLLIYGYKLLIFAVLFVITMSYAFKFIGRNHVSVWMHETLWFVRIIFPLLLVGVFVIGVVSKLLPEHWIREWLGGNGLLQTFIACIIGALSYFSTLTEAPFVNMLMNLGMGKAPALALLLTGPGMSLPNMLAIINVFTVKKATAYILITITVATLASFIVGNIMWSL